MSTHEYADSVMCEQWQDGVEALEGGRPDPEEFYIWLAEHDRRVAQRGFMRGWTAARVEKGIAAATHSEGFARLFGDDVSHSANTPDGEVSLWDLPIAVSNADMPQYTSKEK